MNVTAGDLKQMIALCGLVLLALVYDGELLIMVAGALIGVISVGVYSRVVDQGARRTMMEAVRSPPRGD